MQCSNPLLAKRLQEKKQIEQSTKAAQWAQIQQKTPDIAKIMTDIQRKTVQEFGEGHKGIGAIVIEHHGEVILQSGEFQSVRAGVDGTFRASRI